MYLYHPLIQEKLADYFQKVCMPESNYGDFGRQAYSYMSHADGTSLLRNVNFLEAIAHLHAADHAFIEAGELIITGETDAGEGIPTHSRKRTISYVSTEDPLDRNKAISKLDEKESEFIKHLAQAVRHLRYAKQNFQACDFEVGQMQRGSLQMKVGTELGELEKNLKSAIHPDIMEHIDQLLLTLPDEPPTPPRGENGQRGTGKRRR